MRKIEHIIVMFIQVALLVLSGCFLMENRNRILEIHQLEESLNSVNSKCEHISEENEQQQRLIDQSIYMYSNWN